MSTQDDKIAISHAIARLERDPYFMAWVLAAYRTNFGLTDHDLAGQLICDVNALPKLALCRTPKTTGDDRQFRSDVQTISQYVGCDLGELARVIRAVLSMSTLQKLSEVGGDVLLKAARSKQGGARVPPRSKRKKK